MATARFFYKDPEAPSPNRPIGVGVLALIDSAGALLMDRRSDCGGWGLPGGAVAPDEALEVALLRERPATLETVVAVRRALRECLLQRTPYIASSTSENSLSMHLGE